MNPRFDFFAWFPLQLSAAASVILLSAVPLYAQPEVVWDHRYSQEGDRARNIAAQLAHPEGGLILVGGRSTAEANLTILMRVDDAGDVIWEQVYGDSGDADYAHDVTYAPDGGCVFTGTSNRDLLIQKTNAEGELVWRQTWGGRSLDEGRGIVPAHDGGYIVCGFSGSFGNIWKGVLIHYDEEGDTLWTRLIDLNEQNGQTGSGFHAIVAVADGYVTAGQYGATEPFVVKVDNDGETVWSHSERYPNAEFVIFEEIQSTDGDGFLASGLNSPKAFVRKMDSAGETVWERTYDCGDRIVNGQAASLPGGGGFFAGRINSRFNIGQWWLLQVGDNGDSLWSEFYGERNGWGNIPYSVLAHPDNSVTIAGMMTRENIGIGTLVKISLPEPDEPQGFVIQLRRGWEIYSSPVRPESPNVRDIFSPLVERGTLNLVKDASGRFYAPRLNFSNLPDWNSRQGYLINMSEVDSLTINGEPIAIDTPILLRQGWGIVAYYPENELTAQEAFTSIREGLIIAKDGRGRFYIPAQDFSNMGRLSRGFGYYVKMNADAELVYPNQRER